jgi:hypothetical protein
VSQSGQKPARVQILFDFLKLCPWASCALLSRFVQIPFKLVKQRIRFAAGCGIARSPGPPAGLRRADTFALLQLAADFSQVPGPVDRPPAL